jgi:hypothetical protein
MEALNSVTSFFRNGPIKQNIKGKTSNEVEHGIEHDFFISNKDN